MDISCFTMIVRWPSWARPNTCIEQLTKNEVSALRHPCGTELMFFAEFIVRYRGWRWIFDIKKESAAHTIRLLRDYDRQFV